MKIEIREQVVPSSISKIELPFIGNLVYTNRMRGRQASSDMFMRNWLRVGLKPIPATIKEWEK